MTSTVPLSEWAWTLRRRGRHNRHVHKRRHSKKWDLPLHALPTKKADATAQDPGHGQLSLAQLSQNFDQGPLYQGALVEDSDSRVLLTTYHRTRNFPDIDIKVPTCPVGTMWDYYGQHKNFTWLAPPGISTAGDAQRWLHALPEDPWIGEEHNIWNPDALQLS